MLKLSNEALDWALQHALNYGDTDLFPPCFEFQAIEYDWANLRSILAEKDLDTWAVRMHRRCLAPKGRYAFRVATQLDPIDFLLYSGLVYEVSSQIEAARVTRDRNLVFSFRCAPEPNGRLFSRDVGYGDFIEATKSQLKNSRCSHVAIADIADFYPKIYHHPLENALAAATDQAGHVRCILKLLSGWSNAVSYGVPVGNAPSRLLAELTIADVDEALLASGAQFVRYNDDYRIFADSLAEGYRHIALLANQLYEVHGLTLAPQKTSLMTKEVFEERFLTEPEDREVHELQRRFQELLAAISLDDWYGEIEYDELDEEQKGLIDGLNLLEMFQAEVEREVPDLRVLRFAIRRIGQLGSNDLIETIFQHLDALHPIVPDIVKYLTQIRGLRREDTASLGRRWLAALETSVLRELEYHRAWALQLFADGNDWAGEDAFIPLMAKLNDNFSRRKLILALGRAGVSHWFTANRRTGLNQDYWSRRAFIAAASCMPGDQRNHWYRSIASRLDLLETAVMKWAKATPFA